MLFNCARCGQPLDDCLQRFAKPDVPMVCHACQEIDRQEYQKKEADRIEEARANFRNNLYQTLEKILPDRGVPCRNITNTLANFEGPKPGKRPGCIVGPTGTGKTHLAIGYLKQYIAEQYDAQAKKEITFDQQAELLGKIVNGVFFVSALDFVWRMRKPDSSDAHMKKVCEMDLLVLDDFGAERPTEWATECLGKLIYTRHADMKETLVTSNLSIRDMAQAFNERISSRVAEFGDVLAVQGRNRRIQP